LSKIKIYEVGSTFGDNKSTLNPLEVINTDLTYSSFDLRDTQLVDLMGAFFFIQFGR